MISAAFIIDLTNHDLAICAGLFCFKPSFKLTQSAGLLEKCVL